MPIHPLYREALQHFQVSASQMAFFLNPSLYGRLWPNGKAPVSIAWLCEVVLTTAYAARTGRTAELSAYLATKGIASTIHSPVPPTLLAEAPTVFEEDHDAA